MNTTERDCATIRARIDAYCRAIHTQAAEDFLPLWAQDTENVLISISNRYIGTDSIYRDFRYCSAYG